MTQKNTEQKKRTLKKTLKTPVVFVLGQLAALQRPPCEPRGADDDAGQP